MFWIIISIIISIGVYLIFRKFGFDYATGHVLIVICSVCLGVFLSLIIYVFIFCITWGVCGSKIDVVYETSNPNIIAVEESIDIDDGFLKEHILLDTVIARYLQVTTENGDTVNYFN